MSFSCLDKKETSTYYQGNREKLLNRAEKYYKINKKRLENKQEICNRELSNEEEEKRRRM